MNNPLLRFFGSLKLTVGCLAWLMVLTFWGTLYQSAHGLHEAHKLFFDSWFFLPVVHLEPEKIFRVWIPLPGAMLVMSLMFVNLVVGFFVHFFLGLRMIGLLIAHAGLLLLLGGGFLIRLTGLEGYVYLFEGEGTNLMTSYKDWELSAWEGDDIQRTIHAVSTGGFAPGSSFSIPAVGLTGTVESYFFHSEAFTSGPRQPPEAESASGITFLEPRPREKEPERHIPGAVLRLEADGQSKTVVLYGAEEKAFSWDREGKPPLRLMLRRERTQLPFYLKLQEFTREYYPNSSIPRSYSSLINVRFEDDLARDVKVEMNKPFRYGGFTFFQASFSADQRGVEASKFAVTWNVGRLLPYLATGVTFIGLAWHFLFTLFARVAKGKAS